MSFLTLTNCNEVCRDAVASFIASLDMVAFDEKHFSTTWGCRKQDYFTISDLNQILWYTSRQPLGWSQSVHSYIQCWNNCCTDLRKWRTQFTHINCDTAVIQPQWAWNNLALGLILYLHFLRQTQTDWRMPQGMTASQFLYQLQHTTELATNN